MHPNPIYRRTTDARAFDLVRDRAFGQITLTGPDGLLASHIPVLLAPDETTLDMHLVRSNPILRLLDTPQDALLVVMGPDGYVARLVWCRRSSPHMELCSRPDSRHVGGIGSRDNARHARSPIRPF